VIISDLVPTPRLELQSGSLNDLRSILCELAKNAKLEMKRGNKEAVEELLQVFIESGEKFSTFEKKFVENDRGLQPFARHSKGFPLNMRVTTKVASGKTHCEPSDWIKTNQ